MQTVFRNVLRRVGGLGLMLLVLQSAATRTEASVSAGFMEYYIPGAERQLWDVLYDLDTYDMNISAGMHCVVSVVATEDVTIYYDHWENGYHFDPNDPTNVDEIVVLTAGSTKIFESGSIPVNPRGTSTYYDGGDRFFTAGGGVTVSRASWTEEAAVSTLYGLAWELYPKKPFLQEYIIPVGEDLVTNPGAWADPANHWDFHRTYVIVQATEDNTTVGIDDPRYPGVEVSATLDAGEVTSLFHIGAGTVVTGSAPIQVQFIAGQNHPQSGGPDFHYEIRGFTAVPQGQWGTRYYAPVPGFGGERTDAFLYNQSATLTNTITWRDLSGSGTFLIPPRSTVAFSQAAGHFVPDNSGLILEGTTTFWGIGTVDSESTTYDWGYSLIPEGHLQDDYTIGWAPSTLNANAAGAYLWIAAKENRTTVYVDYSPIDGVADAQFTIDQLEVLKLDDPDYNLTGSRVWASDPIAIVWGEDPDTAAGGFNYLDMGYTTLPTPAEWMDVVVFVDKRVDPVGLATPAGQTATFTIDVMGGDDIELDTVAVIDTLPGNWAYVNNSAIVTYPDGSTLSTNPAVAGQTLTWGADVLGALSTGEVVTVQFEAITTADFADGDVTWNEAKATGARILGSVTQTFAAVDGAYNTFTALTIDKTSTPSRTPLHPGDTIDYRVVVTNVSTNATFSNVSLRDAVPDRATLVAGSAVLVVDGLVESSDNVRDTFASSSYSRQDGSASWASDWIETNDNGTPGGGDIYITGGELEFQGNSGSPIRSIRRQVDLSGADTATLSYRWEAEGDTEANDYFWVHVSSNGADWVQLTLFSIGSPGVKNGSGSESLDISVYASATTYVRFQSQISADNELFRVDDVDVSYASASPVLYTNTSVAFPDILESADGYSLAPGDSAVLTFQVTVDYPPTTGAWTIVNSASVQSDELPVPVRDEVEDDAVYVEPASVGDRVWLDWDLDGRQDPGEPGIANVMVVATDTNGVSVTNWTDTAGEYLFTGLWPGEYTITLPAANFGAGAPLAGMEQTTHPVLPGADLGNQSLPYTVTVTAGASDTTADFGFRYMPAADRAVIGDRVWADTDGDGVQDPNEVGLAGVTVILYGDPDNDHVADVPVATNVTDSLGFYVFTNLVQDFYVVEIAATDFAAGGVLDGFTATGDPDEYGQPATSPDNRTTTDLDIGPGDVFLAADFGYTPPAAASGAIGDRIWLDGDVSADDETGFSTSDSGIPGVTVDLIRDTDGDGVWEPLGADGIAGTADDEPVLATDLTDTDGRYQFDGVPVDDGSGDAAYLVRVTDNNNVLATLAPTFDGDGTGTPDQVAVTLTPAARADTDADFSYAPFDHDAGEGIIGDRIWLDTDGDGVQDAGEVGLAGIVVELYDESAALVATAATDVFGFYHFGNLALDAHYDVVVADVNFATGGLLEGLVNTGDPDGGSDSQSRTSVSVASPVRLDQDFGYRAVTPLSIGNLVWEDLNGDGDVDGGESGIDGVTVALYRDANGNGEIDVGEAPIGEQTTSGGGGYSFGGLAAGNYLVVVTDTGGALSGLEPTVGTADTDNRSQASPYAVTLTVADIAYADFGFHVPVPTLVVLASFAVYPKDGDVLVRWVTAAEIDTVGFDLYRRPAASTDAPAKLNDLLLPSSQTERGPARYYFRDDTAAPGQRYNYWLLEHDMFGAELWYGPFTRTVSIQAIPVAARLKQKPPFVRYAAGSSPRSREDLAAHQELVSAARAQRRSTAGTAGRLRLRETGAYYLSARSLATVWGIQPIDVTAAIETRRLRLATQGQDVLWMPAGDGLYFFGEALDSPFTEDNIYWAMSNTTETADVPYDRVPAPGQPNLTQTFVDQRHFEEDRIAAPAVFSDPAADMWLWQALFLYGQPADPMRFEFDLPNVVGRDAEDAILRLRLVGATDTAAPMDHHARLSLNGAALDDVLFDGVNEKIVELTFPSRALLPGTNVLEIGGQLDDGVAYSYFGVDSFDIICRRRLIAVDDALTFTATAAQSTVSGFSAPAIVIWNVTDPRRPRRVAHCAHQRQWDGAYSMTFATPEPGARYHLFTAAGRKLFRDIEGAAAADLRSQRGADYLAITPLELVDAADALVAYREQNGLMARRVLLEDIYDVFNDGIVNPNAIRAFLTHARRRWSPPPLYVVLLGDGSYDYRNLVGKHDCLVPPLLTATPDGLYASDYPYADLNDDGVPEFAFGRLPALTPADVRGMLAKIRAYEAGGDWKRAVTMLADRPEPGATFHADSFSLGALAEPHATVSYIHLGDRPFDAARRRALAAFDAGGRVYNYVGHAGLDRLSSEGLVLTGDVAAMTNSNRAPWMIGATCAVGRFGVPGYTALAEELVLAGNGGAVAAWAPSSLTLHEENRRLAQYAFEAAFDLGVARLGDAVRFALQSHVVEGHQPYHRAVFTLLGDPATLLNPGGRTAGELFGVYPGGLTLDEWLRLNFTAEQLASPEMQEWRAAQGDVGVAD